VPKLIVNPTSSARREIKLARSLLSIGRDPSNDLVLPDAMVSRRHAVIECRGSQYYLRDCNSSNGSVVNGDKISERSLRDGDLVAIGTARLLYREELELDDPGAKVVQHPSSPRMHCTSCKAEYRKGDLFCRECGAPVQPPAGPRKAVCASCGTAVVLPARFCNACGARLPIEEAPAVASESGPSSEAPPSTELPEPMPAAETSDAEPPATATEASVEPVAAERGPRLLSARSEAQRAAAPFAHEEPGPVPEASPLAAADPKRPAPRASAAASSPRPAKLSRPAGVVRPETDTPALKTRPPLGPRLLAAVVDAVLVALLQGAVVGPLAFFAMSHVSLGSDGERGALPVVVSLGLLALALFLGAAYHVGFWALRGATPGKSAAGLVVTADDGSRLGWGRALARGVGYALSAASLGFGFLMIFFGGLGLHDRIAGTRVVRRPRAVE
jgi:pSer/pThr/pTyr-binding forkhead associated (FHA) protein/uncharacterized RDD family membrane protein YckC